MLQRQSQCKPSRSRLPRPSLRQSRRMFGRGCADHATQLCRSPNPGMIAHDMTSALPFDDFRNLLDNLPAADLKAEARVRALFAKADKPVHSLGRIEDIAAWLAAWSGRAPPAATRPLMAVFAGNHGVTRHGISPRPVAATANA